MAMPHAVAKRMIHKRLKGLEGKHRINEIRKILEELPKYRSGPYGEIRADLQHLIEETRVKSKTKAREIFEIKKEGDFQFVLVGMPSSGKSTLLNSLSNSNVKTAGYQFTTLKPQVGFVQIKGIGFQIVDLPGIIEGAHEDKGLGKRILAVARNSDGLLVFADLSKPTQELDQIFTELSNSNLLQGKDGKIVLAGNKTDLPGAKERFEEIAKRYFQYKPVAISALTKDNLEALKNKLWETTGLICVFCQKDLEKPMALKKNSTVKDFAEKIHKDLIQSFRFAKICGPNAKFQGQKVGINHTLQDGDIVEIFA